MELFKAPSPEMTAYTAGLFDGEGSVWFLKRQNRFSASLAQSEVNDGEELVRWLRAMWDIGTVNKQRKKFHGPAFWCWHWSISARREFLFLLETMLPYLHVKREAAVEGIFWARQHKGTRSTWSKLEDRFLRKHWDSNHGIEEIAAALERGESGVRHRATRLGLPDKRDGRAGGWSEEDLDYLLVNWESQSNAEIAAALDKTYKAVRGKAYRLGLPDKRKMR